MVKNTGGNKSKRLGRKHVNVPDNLGVRYAIEEGEEYAIVTKLHGGNCQVTCKDGTSRMCVIRKKFKGRGKRDNIIMPGVWVLVGVRDWEVPGAGKAQKSDLLEVYSHIDKEKLVQTCHEDLSVLKAICDEDKDGKSNIEFIDSICSESDSDYEFESEKVENEIMDSQNKNDNEIINVDDI